MLREDAAVHKLIGAFYQTNCDLEDDCQPVSFEEFQKYFRRIDQEAMLLTNWQWIKVTTKARRILQQEKGYNFALDGKTKQI